MLAPINDDQQRTVSGVCGQNMSEGANIYALSGMSTHDSMSKPRFEPDGEVLRPGLPRDYGPSRRNVLKAAGAAGATIPLAGCAFLQDPDDDGDAPEADVGDVPDEPLQVGVVAFTSGPAAVFGVPAVNAIEMIVEDFNEQGGLLGEREVELTVVDEAADEPVEDFRRLATEDEVDLVIGYISSGNMLSIAPIAEDLDQFTIIFDAGSNALFDEVIDDPQWVFRTAAHLSVDAVTVANAVAHGFEDVETVAGINQDYSWGRDNMDIFEAALGQLAPDIEVVETRWPDLFTEDFTPHVSALLDEGPDFIYSSVWGGDLTTFASQAADQGLFDESLVCFSAGTHAFGDLGRDTPEGVMWGARGPHFPDFAQDNPLHREFVDSFVDEYDEPPFSHGAYHIWQAFTAYVRAVEKAYRIAGGYPSDEMIVEAMEGIAFHSPSGFIQVNENHQAVESGVIGFSELEDGEEYPTLVDPVWVPPEQVNPPPDLTTFEWIEQL